MYLYLHVSSRLECVSLLTTLFSRTGISSQNIGNKIFNIWHPYGTTEEKYLYIDLNESLRMNWKK